MYKNILIAFIIAIFAGCSAPAPKPETQPSWYTSKPKDYNNFYAVASSADVDKAKKIAINSLRTEILSDLNSMFKKEHPILGKLDENTRAEVLSHNEEICMKLSMGSATQVKSKEYKGETLILVSIPRLELFNQVARMEADTFTTIKQMYETISEDIAIKKYFALKPLMSQYPTLASFTAFKEYAVSTFNAHDDYIFLKNLRAQFNAFKLNISFNVLSDANSVQFAQGIKAAIEAEGFKVSTRPLSKDSLKVLITSVTTDSQDYSYYQSSSLVRYTTYNVNKKPIFFRQHTFVGKSRKSYKDGKRQAEIQAISSINKLGFFEFLGLK